MKPRTADEAVRLLIATLRAGTSIRRALAGVAHHRIDLRAYPEVIPALVVAVQRRIVGPALLADLGEMALGHLDVHALLIAEAVGPYPWRFSIASELFSGFGASVGGPRLPVALALRWGAGGERERRAALHWIRYGGAVVGDHPAMALLLARSVSDASVEVRYLAVSTASEVGSRLPSCRPVLLALVAALGREDRHYYADPSDVGGVEDMRGLAASALGRMGARAAVDRTVLRSIEHGLKGADGALRYWSMSALKDIALGSDRAPAVMVLVADALDNWDPAVRRIAEFTWSLIRPRVTVEPALPALA